MRLGDLADLRGGVASFKRRGILDMTLRTSEVDALVQRICQLELVREAAGMQRAVSGELCWELENALAACESKSEVSDPAGVTLINGVRDPGNPRGSD